MTCDDSSGNSEYEDSSGNDCQPNEIETEKVGSVVMYTVFGPVRREKHGFYQTIKHVVGNLSKNGSQTTRETDIRDSRT